MSLPDWKKVIDTEFNNYKSGKQNKSGYYMNIINYFTGGGTANYPVQGQKVNPTDLSTAELIKYELPAFDIRKIAMAQAIQSNMVDSSRVPRDFAGVKGLIDGMKQDAKFARSPPFDNYSQEEKAIWNNCQVPIIGTGTTNSPNNEPLYNRVCDLFNNPGTQAILNSNNMEKYYGNWAINGVGPADAFMAGDWDKAFKAMTATQLKGFRLPTDDGRRLKILMNIEQYKNAAAKNSSVNKAPYVANINKLFPDNSNVMSPPLTAAERTAFSSLTIPPTMAGGRYRRGSRGRRSSRRTKRSYPKKKLTRRR
jgi:hypothetical protein